MRIKISRVFLAFTFLVLATSAVFVLLALIPLVANDQEDRRLVTRTNLSNAKQLSIAFLMYAADYDGHLPLAENWEEALDMYVKSSGVFYTLQTDGTSTKFTFFEELSGVSLLELTDKDTVPVVFESAMTEKNAHGRLDAIRWNKSGSCAVGFLDGHAEFKPRSWRLEPVILNFSPSEDTEED